MPGLPGAPGVVQQGNSFTNIPNPTPASTAAGAGIHPALDPRAAAVGAALAGLRANGIVPAQLQPAGVGTGNNTVYVQGGNNFTNAGALNAAGVVGPWTPPPAPVVAPSPVVPAAVHAPAAPPSQAPAPITPQQQAQASPIETGLSGAWHGFEGGVNSLAGGLLSAVGLPGAGNDLMGVGRAAFQKQNAQTQALHAATGPESYIGQGINALANYLNPITAPIYAGMSTANAANGRGGIKTVAGSALSALAAAIPGEELLSAAGRPAESLASGAVQRVAQALGKTASPLAEKIGQVGVSSLLGAGSNAAMQVGQNIATRSPTLQGVADAAATGGLALASGTLAAHAIGAALGKIAGKPVEAVPGVAPEEPEGAAGAAVEAPIAPAAGRNWDALLTGEAPTAAPSPLEEPAQIRAPSDALLLTHDGSIKVPPTEEALGDTERQPLSGAIYANDIQDRAQQALQRDADVQNAVSQMAKQSKALALPAPAPFREAVGQYQEIGNILRNPTLDSEGIADAVSRAGVKPTSLPAKIRNAPNIIDALDSHAETASISPERATRLEQAAANVRQHLGLLASHQNTLADYLTSHPALQGAPDNNALRQAHGVAQSLLSAPDRTPSPELDGLLQQYQHNQDVLNAPAVAHPEVQNVLAAAGIKNPIPTSVKNASDLSQALTAHAAKSAAQYPARSGQFTQAASSLGDMLAQKQSEQDALATQIASHPDAVAKPAQESTLTASQDAPTPETPVLTPTEKAAQTGVGAETQGQPLANEIMAENSPEKRVANAATQVVKKAEKQGVVQKPAPVQPTQLSPQERLAAAHAAVAPYLPNPKEKYFPDNTKLPPDIQKAIKDYGKLKPIVDADKGFAADPSSGFDREDRATLTKNSKRLDNLAHLIAAHPAVSGAGDLSDTLDRAASHASDKMHGRIHDIREMTGWNPLDDSQVKRAAIVVRRMFGSKVGLHVADLASKGRRGETDLKDIYLASHALGNGLQTTYHEAWHIARERLLTKSERSMMDKSIAPGTRRFKMLQEWGAKHAGPATREQIESDPVERPALYAEALMTKQLPHPTGMVGRLFAKVQDTLDRIKSGLNGAGFNSTDDLVQKGFAGKFRDREPVMSIPDANDRIDAERRGGVPRDVYERAMQGRTDEPPLYPTSDGVNYHIAGDREAPKSSMAKGVLKWVKDMGERVEPTYVKAMHNPAVKTVHDLMVERGETARKTIAQAIHAAPDFLSPHVLENLKGLLHSNRLKKALIEGDHQRKIFSPEELAKRGLSTKERALYRQYLDGREPGFQAMLGEDKVQSDQTMNALKRQQTEAQEQLELLAQRRDDPATPADQREQILKTIRDKLLPIRGDMKAEERRRALYEAHIDRLRKEGYIPHLRSGNYMAHIQKWMPKSLKEESDLRVAAQTHTAEKARLGQELGLTPEQSDALFKAHGKKLSLTAAQVGGEDDLQKVRELLGHHMALADIPKRLAAIAERRTEEGFDDPLVRLPDLSARGFGTAKEAQADMDRILHPASPESAAAQKLGITLKDGGVTSMQPFEGGTLSPKQIYDHLAALRAAGNGALSPEDEAAFLRHAGAARSAAMNDLVNRKDVAGENDDLVQALSQFTGYHAHSHASAMISSRMQEALHKLNDPQTGDPEAAEYVSRWLDGLNKAEVSKDPVMSRARAAAMYMILGGRLPAALYTLGSNTQMTLAHLARNESIPAADMRYAKALKDTALLTPKKMHAAVAAKKGIGGLSATETKSLYDAHLRGVTDAQYAYLQDNANPHVQGASAVARLGRATKTALMSPLATVESRLRQATYLAALRQHADLLKGGKTPLMSALDHEGNALPATDAGAYAREMTKQSNQSFEPEDQAPIFNMANGDGKTLFMFQGPMLQMAFTLAHLARTNPKLFATTMAGATALGGVNALPMYNLVNNILGGANQVSAEMGGPAISNSPNTELDKKLDELHPGLASLAQHGLPDELIQHVLGKTAPDVAPYFQIGSAGDGMATGIANTLIKAAGGTPAVRAAPIPIVSLLEGIRDSAGAVPNAISTGDWNPVFRPGAGDALLKAGYAAEHALATGQRTNVEGSHPYPVTPGEILQNALGLNSIQQNNMFNTIGQRDYRAGMQKMVTSEMGTLIKDAANDRDAAGIKAAIKLGQTWDASHPDAPVMLNGQTIASAEMAAHENPVLAQLIRQMKGRLPVGLKTYGTN